MREKRKILGNISLSFLIMVAMISVLILSITLISAISYTETITNLEHDWDMSLMNTARHLSDSVGLVTTGLRLFELTYDADMKEAFIPFLDAYNASDGDPLSIDLSSIKSGLPPALSGKMDLYIINKQGIVINTTYPPDYGLDFSQWPEVFDSVEKIRKGSEFVSDRAVIGFNNDKKVKKYAYLPTPDHLYVLELSTIIEEFPEERDRFSFLSVADTIAGKNPNIISVTLYDQMGRKILPDYSAPEESDNSTRDLVLRALLNKEIIQIPDPQRQTTDTFIHINSEGNETVSDKMLDIVAKITYDTSLYNARLQSTFYYHLIIALVSVFLGIFLIYLLTSHLTRPIRKIIEDIDIIANGDLDHPIHHTGSPEFVRLEGSMNILVNSLKTLIEKLREKEKHLIASEHRYRSLIESQRDLIIRLDAVGKILFVNKTFIDFFGYPDVVGRSLFDLVTEEKRKDITQFISVISENQQTAIFDLQVTLQNQETRWLQWSSTGIFLNGQLIEYQATGRDITAKKLTEIALTESDEKYRSLIANLPDYIVVHQKGSIIYVNKLASQVLGYSLEEIIGSNIFSYIPEDEHQMIIKNMNRRIAGELIPEYEFHIIQKSGGIRVVTIRSSTIPYGGETALLTVLTDITDKKRSEDELRKGEIRYYNLIEQLNEGILTANEQAEITFTNKKMQQLLQYSESELLGRSYLSIISPDLIPVMEVKMHNRLCGIAERYEMTFISRDGSHVYAEVSATPTFDSSGRVNGSLGVISDNTDRKNAEFKISRYMQDLEHKTHELEILRDELFTINKNLDRIVRERTEQVMNLLRQKDEFIMQLGHDLRTPLTPIIGLLPGLIEDEVNRENRHALNMIEQNVKYIQDITSKSLKLAKMNSFNISPEIEPVDVKSAVTNLVSIRADDLTTASITVTMSITDDLTISVDKILFNELLDNILSNGIKYIQRLGGVMVISAMKVGDFAEIRITDNGIGLRAEEQEKVFEEFYKSDRSRHDKSSTGLGLSICRRIVEKHGGCIKAESPGPGKGTSFIIMIPIWNEEKNTIEEYDE